MLSAITLLAKSYLVWFLLNISFPTPPISTPFKVDKISFIKAGTTGNLNLYAKWVDSAVQTVERKANTLSIEDYNLISLEPGESKEEIWYLEPGYSYVIYWSDYNSDKEILLSSNDYTSIDAKIQIYSDSNILIKEEDNQDKKGNNKWV